MAVLDLILGPIVIGTFLNVLLYGVLVMQGTVYYISHRKDKTWMKLMVAWLLLLDTLSSVFNVGFVYRYTITLFGNFEAIGHSHWFFHISPLMTVTIASTTQLFFAWRVGRLTGRAWVGWTIAIMVFVQFFAGAATSAAAWIIVDFSRFGEVKPAVIVWLAMASVADVVITCVLTWYLHSHRTGFPRTDDVITRIIRLTIQTGLVTSLWATVDLILYLSLPNNLHFLFNIPLCKFYTNSLLSTLNSRSGWGSDMSGSVVIGTANGISVNVTTISEHDKVVVRGESQPEEHSNGFDRVPRQTNNSFELDEYMKSYRADLEQGRRPGKLDRSSAQMLDGVSGSQNVTKKVDITQLHLSPYGKQASASEEWSINCPSAEFNRI